MSGITRIRNKSFEKWFTINLAIHDLPADVLSTDGKAFHTYLASKPDGWEYNRDHAIKIIGSGHKVDKAGAELKALGLLKVEKIREKGRFVGFDWKIETEMPDSIGDSPFPDIPDPVTPDPVIQDTLKEIPREEKLTLSEKLTPGARQPETLPIPFAEDKPAKPKRLPSTPNGFDEFWQAYPKKVAKPEALKAWAKLKPDADTQASIQRAIAERSQGDTQWAEPRFIPNPATYLNQRRWEDEWRPQPGQVVNIQPTRMSAVEQRAQNDFETLRRYL